MGIKKLLPLLLVIVMMIGMCSMQVFATETETYSGECGETATWSLDATTGVLTISGTGVMDDYEHQGAPWWAYNKQVTAIVIENGITEIGRYAFEYCVNAVSVSIPDSVTQIEDYAFMFCQNLRYVVIPAGVTSVGAEAFYGCELLSTVVFEGDAPAVDYSFGAITALAFYDFNNATWTDEAKATFGGNLVWEDISGIVVLKHPDTVTAETGSTAVFSTLCYNTGVAYQWQVSTDMGVTWTNATDPGNQTAQLSVEPTNEKHGLYYRCVITDGTGSTYETVAADLIVVPALNIAEENQQYTLEVPYGQYAFVHFKPEVSGTYVLQYQCDDEYLYVGAESHDLNTFAPQALGHVYELEANVEYVFRFCPNAEREEPYEIVVRMKKPEQLVLGTPAEISIDCGRGDLLLFTPAETGEYYLSGLDNWFIHDPDRENPEYGSNGGYQMTAGVEYKIYTDNYGESTKTYYVLLDTAHELAIGQEETCTMKAGNDKLYFVTPEETNHYEIAISGVSHYSVMLNGEYISTDDYGLYTLEQGQTYAIRVYAGEECDFAIKVAEPTSVAMDQTYDLTIPGGYTRYVYFTPTKTQEYLVECNDGFSITVYNSNNESMSTSYGDSYLLTEGERYRIGFYNWAEEETTASVAVESVKHITDGQVSVELDAYEGTLFYFIPAATGSFEFRVDHQNVNIWLYDQHGNYLSNVSGVYFLASGQTYRVEIRNNYENAQTLNVSVGEPQRIEEGTYEDIVVAGDDHVAFTFAPSKSGEYKIKVIGNNYSFDFKDANGEYVSESWGMYCLEEGKVYTLRVDNGLDTEQTFDFVLKYADTVTEEMPGTAELAPYEDVIFYYKPAVSGEYVIDLDSTLLSMEVLNSDDTAVYLDAGTYDLTAGQTYRIVVNSDRDETVSFTLTVSTPPVLELNVSEEFTLGVSREKAYYFKPETTGNYIVTLGDNACSLEIIDSNGTYIDATYGVYRLEEGQRYKVKLVNCVDYDVECRLMATVQEQIKPGYSANLNIPAWGYATYQFVPEISGSYAFALDIDGNSEGVDISLTDREGFMLDSSYYPKGRLCFLKAGEEYTVIIQNSNITEYSCVFSLCELAALETGISKEIVVDTSVYLWFTPEKTGDYVLECGSSSLNINLYDDAANYIMPNSGLYTLQEGIRYTVELSSGEKTETTVKIGKPKALELGVAEEVSVNGNSSVVFCFTPDETGCYVLNLPDDFHMYANYIDENGNYGMPHGINNNAFILNEGVEYRVFVVNTTNVRADVTVVLEAALKLEMGASVNKYWEAWDVHYFSFTPEQTGFYAIQTPSGLSGSVFDESMQEPNGTVISINGTRYVLLYLTENETYLIVAQNHGGAVISGVVMAGREEPESIVLATNNKDILVGDSTNLEVSFKPMNSRDTIVWSVDQEGIVSLAPGNSLMEPTCQVIGLNAGKVTVTATAGNGVSASFVVTVSEAVEMVTGVTNIVEITEGSSKYFSFTPDASGYYVFGYGSGEVSIKMMDSLGERLEEAYIVGDYHYYELEEDETYVCQIRNYGETGEFDVRVDACTGPTEVTIPEKAACLVGNRFILRVQFGDYTEIGTCTWEIVEGEEFITLSPFGKDCQIHCVAPGTAIVKVTSEDGQFSETCQITVTEETAIEIGFSEQVTIMPTGTLGYLFTPEESGWYCVTGMDGVQIDFIDDELWVNSEYRVLDKVRCDFAYLEKGVTYDVQLYCFSEDALTLTVSLEKCVTPESATIVVTRDFGKESRLEVLFEPFGSFASGCWHSSDDNVVYFEAIYNASCWIWKESGAAQIFFDWEGGVADYQYMSEDCEPFLSYKYVSRTETGWTSDVQNIAGDLVTCNKEGFYVFCINYLDAQGNVISEPVYVESTGVVEMQLMKDMEDIAQDLNTPESQYYYRISADAWGLEDVVSYVHNGETVTRKICIRREALGFYSEPEISDDTYIQTFYANSDNGDGNVFYIGLDPALDEYYVQIIDLFTKFEWDDEIIYGENHDKITVELLGNNIGKVTINEDALVAGDCFCVTVYAEITTAEAGSEIRGVTIDCVVPSDEMLTGWVNDGGNWYYYVNGTMLTGWLEQNGVIYYLKADGTMATGWQWIGSQWYYFNGSGAMQTGWLKLGSVTYYLQDDGVMATGWQEVDSNYYYINTSGAKVTGWLTLNEATYYLGTDGIRATGLTEIEGIYYYFNEDGVMATGWVTHNGMQYLFGDDGAAVNGWVQIGEDRYYLKKSGLASIGWTKISGHMYLFNDDGVMQTGWASIEGNRCYLQTNGAAATGWTQIEGKYYYFDSECMMQTGWLELDGTTYYLKADGTMATGWQRIDGVYYYFNEDGKMRTGWLEQGSTTYYLKADGTMATGWQRINGQYYYFNASGAMQKGWLKLGNNWFYLKPDGAMVTGTYKIDGAYYGFNADGVMVTGWQVINGKWHLFNGNGTAKSGWIANGSKWYYLAEDGEMTVGLKKISGYWYYFDGNGYMTTGWQKVDGNWHLFNGNGTAKTGWYAEGGKWYYLAEDGEMTIGWKAIGGSWYYFNSNGYMTTGWQQVGGNWFYMNGSGVMVTGWLKLGTNWYYFNSSGAMVTGTHTIGGRSYTFNASGVWVA